MKKLDATVIIWGNDNYNVLGLLRQLTPYVENVIFLVNNKINHCAIYSRFCKQYKIVSGIKEGIRYLIDFGFSLNHKAFIITTSDLLAAAVDLNSEKLSRYYFLCTTKEQGELNKALDKNYQCAIARQVGINVPDSREFRWNSPISNISYPCLIKPSFKAVGVRHPFKTCICNNLNDIIGVQKIFDKNGTYTLQQLVKKEKDILIYGCRFEDGRTLYGGSFTKYRWANNGDGSYGILSFEIPECINEKSLDAFLNKINYFGLFSAEFGIENETAWFYEFNLRNDGTSHYFYQAGICNLPLIWIYCHIYSDHNYPSVISNKKECSVFIDEINDYDNVKSDRMSKAEWKKDYKKASVYKYYAKNDRMPWCFEKVRQSLSCIYHMIKK